jgi:hypothetical protein
MTVFNETEQEAIILNAMWGMINDMVNYQMFVKTEHTTDVVLLFSTSTHMRLFNVLLVDFLSQPQPRQGGLVPFDLPKPPPNARQANLTHLFYLRQVCATPKLGPDASMVAGPLNGFSDWLEAEALVEKVWLPSINTELDLRIGRLQFIKICGDIAKHNFLRLSKNVKRLRQVLKANGHIIDDGQAYLVLPEFYEWFHRDIFAYHSSTIAEYLNNLRLGIFAYLQHEYARAYHEVEPRPMYRFHIPSAIKHPLAKEMYWELMNMVRARPYMPRFEVSQYVKMRY